jgi:flagellar FliL protein
MSEPTPTDAKPVKPAGNSKLMMVIGMVVAAAVAGGGAWTFAKKDAEEKAKLAAGAKGEGEHPKAKKKTESSEAEGEGEDSGEDEPAGEGSPSHTVNLPPFLVNLGPDFSDMHYLKVSIGVEVANEEAAKVFEEHGAKVRNNVLMYLSTLKADEIQGAESRTKILARLRTEVRKAVGAKKVQGVYLTEFVIQ